MQQDQTTARNMVNILRTMAKWLARLVSIPWVFLVVVGPPAMYLLSAGEKSLGYFWFAVFQVTAISAAIIPFKWVRVGGALLVAHGLGVFLLLEGHTLSEFEFGTLPQLIIGLLYILSARPQQVIAPQ
jgi:hypothetical protein